MQSLMQKVQNKLPHPPHSFGNFTILWQIMQSNIQPWRFGNLSFLQPTSVIFVDFLDYIMKIINFAKIIKCIYIINQAVMKQHNQFILIPILHTHSSHCYEDEIKLNLQQKTQALHLMIYDGPILDPRHRYYVRQTEPIQNSHNYSPRSGERFSKYKGQPVNLSRISPVSQNLSNSNIYTKQGLLKRNQMGWDGVKLTEYVTEQLSDNYLQNQRILQKFRREAEENRKAKKFGHAYENRLVSNQDVVQVRNYLPAISPGHQQTNPSRYSPVSIIVQPEDYQIYEAGLPHFRNVGVNTHKNYEKSQLHKYIKLLNKYQTLKQKYERQKQLRRMERRKMQEKEEKRQREMASIEKIKDIEHELMNISIKLQTSNQMIAQQINSESRKRQMAEKQQKNSPRRLKTEPEMKDDEFDPEAYEQLVNVPKNPLQKMKIRDVQKKVKYPTIEYTRRQNNIDPDFVAKYTRNLG